MLGLCTLISAAPAHPGVVEECAQQILPSLLNLFEGLKKAYAAKAAENEDDEDGEEEEEGEEVMVSDEEDIDLEDDDCMERMKVFMQFILFMLLK